MTSTTTSDREIIPTSPTDIFKNLTVFIDPSVPTILAIQLKAFLTHNQASIASESTPDIEKVLASIQAYPPTDPTDPAAPSKRLIPNLKPRFDLTQTTHIITNSLHLPEYIALGRWDDEAGNILSFSYQAQSSPGNVNEHEQDSEKEAHDSRVHRSIHLVTSIWVTQSYDLDKLLPTGAYSPDPYKFLSGIVIALDSGARLPLADVELIQACVQAWGGQFRKGLTKEVTHLICCDENTRDYKIANKLKVELGLKIVLPHWFHHSVSFRRVISEQPFEFPSPAILAPRSPSLSADCQHGINGLPGTKLPPTTRRPIEEDPELESLSHKKATDMAFAAQKISPRPHSLEDTPAYREFQNKSVYLVSSLGLSFSARKTLARRIEELGAKVFDSGSLKLTELDKSRSDPKILNDAINAEQKLKSSDIVICECRSGWEFWLAWEAGKKIGTLHWILCILNNLDSPTFAIRPPTERLLDFPCPPGPISGCDPASKPITVTNYAGMARSHLIKLIEKMHLTFSGTLASNTFMVVAANKAGSKVDYANKTGIQIVNHHYIEDCFQNWAKQSIQPHHLTFPDGVNICELVGQTTRTPDGIYKWTKRTEVKEQKKRDMSLLPSRINKTPLADISSMTPPQKDVNPQPSASKVISESDNLLDNSESGAEVPAVKRVKRKPRLISDSTELSSLTASDILKVAGIETLETPRKPSSQESLTPREVEGHAPALITPEPSRSSPRKRSSDLAELDPNPSKKTKKETSTDTEAKKLDTTAQQSVTSSTDQLASVGNDQLASVGGQESSKTSTPLQSKFTKSVKQSVSTKKATVGASAKAPLSLTRSSTRKAAQLAVQNVKSAAEDMNLHEKEKKKKRISGGPSVGMDDGGFFGQPPKKAKQSASRKRSHDSHRRLSGSESDGDQSEIVIKKDDKKQSNLKRGRRSDESEKTVKEDKREDERGEESSSDNGELPSSIRPQALSKRKGKRASGGSKTARDEEAKNSDLESLTDLESLKIKSAKKPKKKIKAEDPELDNLSKSKPVDHLPRKTKSTSGSKAHPVLAGPSSSKKICITESGARIESKISNKLVKMGAKFIDSTPSLDDGCTHLLTNKIARTEKFLSCIVLGCSIVNHKWAEECVKRNQFVDEEEYELKDLEGEKLHQFELKRSLKIARARKILTGFQIFLTPFVANQHSKLLKKLIILAGGQVLTKIPALEDLQKTATAIKDKESLENDGDDDDGEDVGEKKSLIISSKEDSKYVKTHLLKKFPTKFWMSEGAHQDPPDDDDDLREQSPLIKIFDSNLILQGLLVQKITFEEKFVLDCSGFL
ncbi:hypothetical protein, variant [Puccinia triticina 1-1 BBBD Race 1]|uniref:BRCT domain-containing protein n=1 Tax=Puccinia triticina (isolate 1-1 / race 1 (BBBD)) TaxID=630390 RepID=A0A180G6D1_PUCT1|nr:hypothetical protein, variant [Puccinia triticina 1-1 BBBD Race 1]